VARGGYERVPFQRLSECRDRKEELMVTADYNLVRERVDLYVERTGLSRAAVNAYRKTPTSEWATLRDRRIGRAIRGMELLWRDPDVSVEMWLRIARGVTRAIYDLINAVIKTVSRFTSRLAKVMGRAIAFAVRTADGIEEFIKRHPRLLKSLRLAFSAVLDWAVRTVLRWLTKG